VEAIPWWKQGACPTEHGKTPTEHGKTPTEHGNTFGCSLLGGGVVEENLLFF